MEENQEQKPDEQANEPQTPEADPTTAEAPPAPEAPTDASSETPTETPSAPEAPTDATSEKPTESEPDKQGADKSKTTDDVKPPKKVKSNRPKINKFTLLFVVLLMVGIGVIVYVTIQKTQEDNSIATVELDEESLSNLSSQQTEVDSEAQLLTISPDTEFNGSVIVKENVEVIGDLVVSGTLTTNITPDSTEPGVQDTTNIPGDLNLQGNLSVGGNIGAAGNLNIGGDGLFTGDLVAASITTAELNLSSGFEFSEHIVTNAGSTSSSTGGAVGVGGTSSVNGDDIAGSITVNTGTGAGTGILINVNFRVAYNKVPRVIISPVTAAAAEGDFYVTRTKSGFSIHSANDAPDASSINFDYFVVE